MGRVLHSGYAFSPAEDRYSRVQASNTYTLGSFLSGLDLKTIVVRNRRSLIPRQDARHMGSQALEPELQGKLDRASYRRLINRLTDHAEVAGEFTSCSPLRRSPAKRKWGVL
jgi:hypothetical protein